MNKEGIYIINFLTKNNISYADISVPNTLFSHSD